MMNLLVIKQEKTLDNTIIEWQNEAKELCTKTLNENWDMIEKVVIALIGDGNNNGNETLDSQWIIDLSTLYRTKNL